MVENWDNQGISPEYMTQDEWEYFDCVPEFGCDNYDEYLQYWNSKQQSFQQRSDFNSDRRRLGIIAYNLRDFQRRNGH